MKLYCNFCVDNDVYRKTRNSCDELINHGNCVTKISSHKLNLHCAYKVTRISGLTVS